MKVLDLEDEALTAASNEAVGAHLCGVIIAITWLL